MGTDMDTAAFSDLTTLQKFFFGKNVFVTGTTGLVGKVLVEKLLRCCPGIGTIFVMMRPKRGKSIEDRTEKIFNSMLFSGLKEICPDFRKRIHVFYGDLEKKGFGISDSDFLMLKDQVSIVFHAAARVQFNQKLRVAVQTNLLATLNLLEICKEMPNLITVAHVSTAYVRRQPDNSSPEIVPSIEISPDQLLSALEWIDEATEQQMEKMLTKINVNTYLLTKTLTEVLIDQKHGDIPTAIIRPGLIGPTVKEPFGGWMDMFQSVSGLFLAASKGVLRCFVRVPNLKLELVPVDFIVNTMIVAAYHTSIHKLPDPFIVNCTVNPDKAPYADEFMLEKAMAKRVEYPLASFFRYPDFKLHYSKTTYYIHSFFDQWIPAIFCDFFLYIFTGRTILCKVHNKINFIYGMTLKTLDGGWKFKTDNLKLLQKNLSEKDSEIFFLDIDDMDWDKYVDDSMKVGRIVLGKEDPSNIPYAKKKAFIWWLVTTILKWCLIVYVIYCLLPTSFIHDISRNVEERFYMNSI